MRLESYIYIKSQPSEQSRTATFWPQYLQHYARREDDELEVEYSKRLDAHMLEKARAHLLLDKIMTGAWIA